MKVHFRRLGTDDLRRSAWFASASAASRGQRLNGSDLLTIPYWPISPRKPASRLSTTLDSNEDAPSKIGPAQTMRRVPTAIVPGRAPGEAAFIEARTSRST